LIQIQQEVRRKDREKAGRPQGKSHLIGERRKGGRGGAGTDSEMGGSPERGSDSWGRSWVKGKVSQELFRRTPSLIKRGGRPKRKPQEVIKKGGGRGRINSPKRQRGPDLSICKILR